MTTSTAAAAKPGSVTASRDALSSHTRRVTGLMQAALSNDIRLQSGPQ